MRPRCALVGQREKRQIAGAQARAWLHRHLLAVASAGFVLLALPVVWRGAPLADDFANCLRPAQDGLGTTLADSWDRLGAIRPARFLEILLTHGVCERLPFGFAIAVPLALTLAVAWLLRGLLRDLRFAAPWPDVAGTVWLLQPLGTEAALWPAALHVPLGLALALGSLRLLRRGRWAWGVLAAAGAFGSAEQTILALPVAAWVTGPSQHRRKGSLLILGLVAALGLAVLVFPGEDQRLQAGLVERLTALLDDPAFYVQFPAVGLGLHSIPLALWWALPWSLLALAAGAVAGGWLAAHPGGSTGIGLRLPTIREAATAVALLAAINGPVLANVPRQGSPRVFTPTWLLVAALVAVVFSQTHLRRPHLAGSVAGLLAAGAVLSLTLSVSVRLDSADAVELAAHQVAARAGDGADVAVCEVPRAVTEPAPRGAFAVNDFLYDWAATDAVAYHTGQAVTVQVFTDECPTGAETSADLVASFSQLTDLRQGR